MDPRQFLQPGDVVRCEIDGLGHIGLQMGPDGDKNQMRYYNGFTEHSSSDLTPACTQRTQKREFARSLSHQH